MPTAQLVLTLQPLSPRRRAGMDTHSLGLSLRPSVASSVRESGFVRRPRPLPLPRPRPPPSVVQFDGKTFPPPPSPLPLLSTLRYFPLVRLRHRRRNALCTSSHRLLTIMPGRRKKLTRTSVGSEGVHHCWTHERKETREERGRRRRRRRRLEPSTKRSALRCAVLGPFHK